MEKMMVIAGIWAMCASCAVLFIRGATMTGRERVLADPVNGDDPGSMNDPDAAIRRTD